MSQVELRPTKAYTEDVGDIIGTHLADDSDATYIEANEDLGRNYVGAYLEALSPERPVSQAALYVRIAAFGDGSVTVQPDLINPTEGAAGASLTYYSGGAGLPLAADGVIRDLEWDMPVLDFGYTAEDVGAALADRPGVEVYVAGAGYSVRVYEIGLILRDKPRVRKGPIHPVRRGPLGRWNGDGPRRSGYN